MTSYATVAQAAASADNRVGQALHLISRIHGRLDSLEAAIAARDARLRLTALLQIGELLDELRVIEIQREAA